MIGLLGKKGANLVGQDQDDILVMPWTTVRKRLQGSAFANVDYVLVSGHSTVPGATAFTRTAGASSSARHFVRCKSAAFEVA